MKLMATLHPSSDWTERATVLCELGIAAFRVNFAPYSARENAELLRGIRALCAERAVRATILADLPGRKARVVGPTASSRTVAAGEEIVLTADPAADGQPHVLRVSEPELLARTEPGDVLCVGDITLVARSVRGAAVTCAAERAGLIVWRSAIQNPARYRPRRALLPEDVTALTGGAAEADILGVSFADSPEVMHAARELAERHGARPSMTAKIETAIAVECADAVGAASDALMVGRGDLGQFLTPVALEQATECVASVSRARGKPVLLATNYFKSLALGQDGLTTDELTSLAAARRLDPAYLILNETASSRHWRTVAKAALAWSELGVTGTSS